MKRLLFLFMLVLASGIYAQNTLPVIPFGERKADLYYWDTNWYDKYERDTVYYAQYPGTRAPLPEIADMYIGRTCLATTPILVRGIAGAVSIQHRFTPEGTLDTTIAGRLPEEFMLYSGNYELLGESRWDTVAPTYRMEFRWLSHRDTFDVYEALFDKPVLVNGLFFVGGTTHNNLQYGYSSESTIYFSSLPHLWTVYPGYSGLESLAPNLRSVLRHYYWPYYYVNPFPNEPPWYDTVFFELCTSIPYFYPFFAIIDTNYVYMDCQRPTGLRVDYADEDSVVVAWEGGGAPQWDVVLWAEGTEPDSGMLYSVGTNSLTLYGLNPDGQYYVKVKAVCDTMHINTSAWSGVFGFRASDYFVQPCPVPEGLRVQPVFQNCVVVRWNHSDAGLCELALWREDGTDTVLMQSQTEYVEVDDLDTAVWYAARLRAVCDSANISEWSDTVRFFVPNWDTTGGGTDPVGIVDAVGRSVELMPNPTSGKVTVRSPYLLRRVELFGSDGKAIVSFEAEGHTASLDLGPYPAGPYIVRVTTSSGVANKRLVKK